MRLQFAIQFHFDEFTYFADVNVYPFEDRFIYDVSYQLLPIEGMINSIEIIKSIGCTDRTYWRQRVNNACIQLETVEFIETVGKAIELCCL